MRNAAEKRHKDFAKAIRKRRIDREKDPSPEHQDKYDNLHQYSKNKIHYSGKLRKKRVVDRRDNEKLEFEKNEFYNLNVEKDNVEP